MEIDPKTLDALRVQKIDGALIVPSGFTAIHAERFQDEPSARRGKLGARSLASFVDYVNHYGNADESIVLGDIEDRGFLAILDWHNYDDPDLAGWGDHRVSLSLERTPALVDWMAINGRLVSQANFAEFIEEHLEHIASPSAADVLTVATTLSGKRNIEYTSGVRLDNGDTQITWNEKTEAKTAGDLRVPSEIKLRLPVFRGCEEETTFDFRALFRYRINEGQLRYEVKILGLEQVIDLAFSEIKKAIVKGVKSSATYYDGGVLGNPRKSLP